MKLKIFLLLLFALLGESFSAPKLIDLNDARNEYNLGKYLEIYRDHSGKLTINDIISPEYAKAFKRSHSKILNLGYTDDAVWLRLKIRTNFTYGKGLPWILELKNPHLNYIDYYLFSDDGLPVDSLKTGSLRSSEYQYPLIIFKPRGQHDYTFYLRIKSMNTLLIPVSLYSAQQFIKQHHRDDLLNGLYLGMMFIMLIINLFAFYSLKDRSYLFFSLYIIVFLLFYISNTGFGAILLWPGLLKWNFISPIFFVIIGNIIFINFTNSFLRAKKLLPKWHKLYFYSSIFSLVLLFGIFYFSYRLSSIIVSILTLFNLIITVAPVYLSWKNGSKAAGLFLLSMIGLVVGVFEYILVIYGFLPHFLFQNAGLTYGSLYFVMLMSLSLRNRITTIIKEKEEADKSLEVSEQKLRSIVETTRDIIWEVDQEGKYTYVSPTFEIILGYKPSEAIGKPAFEFMPKKEAERIEEIYRQYVSNKKPFIQLENVNIHKNGKEIILESSGVPFFDKNNQFLGYRGIDRDITARKQAIAEKEKSEKNLRALLNATKEIAFLIDSGYKIIIANKAIAAVYGKSTDDLKGEYALDLLPDKLAEHRKEKLDKALKLGKVMRWEDRSQSYWWDNTVYPIVNSSGEVLSLAVFSADITKRKKAELIREVMLNIANAVFITKNTKELYKTIHKEINKLINAKNFFVGLYNEEENTLTMPYIVDEKDDFTGVKVPLEKTLSAQVILHKKPGLFTSKDMTDLDNKGITGSGYGTPSMSWLGVPLLDDNDRVIGIIVIQDYSIDNAFSQSDLSLMEFVSKQVSMAIMRKQAEEQIHILSQSIEQNPTIIMITDTEGYIEYVNPSFSKITGYTYKETIGKKPSMLKSGETQEQVYKELWQTIKAGKDWKGEFHNKKKNGDFYWEYTHITPIINDEGEITHYLALKEDVSEQKKLQQQLIQSQRMEAIGTLAGGIAHDFNNLLTVIKGFSEIALLKTDDSSPIHKDIQAILSASNRAEKLTKQILAFSRKQIYQPRIISINTIIRELEGMIHRLIGEDIAVELNLIDDLPKIKADPSQIEQILMNLIINARDAIHQVDNFKGYKKIIIRSDRTTLPKELKDEYEISDSNQYILFSVRDNGAGIADDIKQYVFDPFFTTKETGKGTGLGLATVYGIVKQNKGFVHFDSRLGKGSEFIIYWPVSEEKTEQKDNIESQNSQIGGNETILFVENDENLLKFGETVLCEFGYDVLTASNGEEALNIAKTNHKIDILITDFLMPAMDGKQLSENIRNIIPAINIILISGYNQEHFDLHGEIDFLQKPFSVQSLLSKVREILDRK